MITRRALLGILAFQVVVPSVLSANCLPTLQLELSVAAPTIGAQGPLDVTVTLRNPLRNGAGPSVCAVFPGFVFELEPNTEGYPVVLFEVVSPTGKALAATKGMATIPARPPLESFRYLAPGQFFGRTVSLGDAPFGFETQALGSYKITARLTTAARDYYAATLKKMKGKTWSSVEPKDVFQGDLRSNTVEVIVK